MKLSEYTKMLRELVDAMEELEKFCPCGGIILADTDDFRTPLCNECYSQTITMTLEAL